MDGSLLRASTKTNLLSFLRLLPKKKKRNDKNILDNYKTLNRTTTNTKLTVACLKIQPGAIFSRQYIITYYVFLNELDVISARKCHSVQKRKRKTAVVCFYVRSWKIKLKFRGHRSQAAETTQKGRRHNNVAWSKLFWGAKQFLERTFVLHWPECGLFHSRATFINIFFPVHKTSKNTPKTKPKTYLLLKLHTSFMHSRTIPTWWKQSYNPISHLAER